VAAAAAARHRSAMSDMVVPLVVEVIARKPGSPLASAAASH
jgi:hypothetical protein